MKRRNFLGVFLGTIGALPFVKAETVFSLFEEQPRDYYKIDFPYYGRSPIEMVGEAVKLGLRRIEYIEAYYSEDPVFAKLNKVLNLEERRICQKS